MDVKLNKFAGGMSSGLAIFNLRVVGVEFRTVLAFETGSALGFNSLGHVSGSCAPPLDHAITLALRSAAPKLT